MSTSVVQVVPDFGPYAGVASYARTLAAGLAERNLTTRFVVAGVQPAPPQHGEPAALEARSARSLVQALELTAATRVVLHYSNYGYARRGCPLWLVAGAERWRERGQDRRLVTVFHELYATGRPWQSSFWLSPLQRRLARRTSRASDALVTSVDHYGERLRAWSPGGPLEVLPVFSTLGENDHPAPLSSRRAQMVVFGSDGVRARAYRGSGEALATACRALQLERILDVGPGNVAPRNVGGFPVECRGSLPAEALTGVLSDSRAGFLAYPAAYLAKSTVFAAYCAFALVPVCAWPGETGAATTNPAPRWNPGDGPLAADRQEIALRAHSWYAGHSLARQVEAYGSLLE